MQPALSEAVVVAVAVASAVVVPVSAKAVW